SISTPNTQYSVTHIHLPLQFTRFFGREEEVSRLSEILSLATASPCHLFTLTGVGGSGKTRLAIETAGIIAEAFPGGVWFVPLADLSDPRLIPGAILDALRLPHSPQVEPLDQVVGYLSGQAGHVLLVLDNFEHLLLAERRKSEDGAAV